MIKPLKLMTVAGLAMAAVAGSVQAEYPEKPVEFVFLWPPGDLEEALDRNTLGSIGAERIAFTPDTATVAELAPSLDVALWNGLFVHADTPADVIENIAAVAEQTMASKRAQTLAAETGALVYWQPADEVSAQIAQDTEATRNIEAVLAD